ncbi:MAG: RNA methyltransferase [Clostridia bacterium]|nr:RNA methyltransferase [Clostridia bacterium]
MVISSKDNELIKHLKRLKEKKYRDEFGQYIVEGKKMLDEAFNEKVSIKRVVVSESFSLENDISTIEKNITDNSVSIISDKLFKEVSNVVTNQGVIAIIEKRAEMPIDFEEGFYLILDNIQDPGNMGTIIRTLDSLNIKQMIVSSGCVEVYNPKVIRSTMGAIYRVNIIQVPDLVRVVTDMKENGIKVYATDLNTDKTIYSVNYENTALIIGNEANGVEEKVKNIASERIKIPMLGKTESLNAAVATSIILFEAYRNILK